jgi:hypothetical protein
MHARLQKDNYEMKKTATLILSTALIAAMIAGCGGKLNATDPSTDLSGMTTTTEAPVETTPAPAYEGPKTFEELYGNQIMTYLEHQYYFDGNPIMKQEANFYFINTFIELSNDANMGYYPMTGMRYIDLAAEVEGESHEKCGDIFLRKAEEDLETAFIKIARAEAEGVTLSEDTNKLIDEWISNIKTQTIPSTGLSEEEYFAMWYGPGMNEDILKMVIQRFFLVEEFESRYVNSYEIKKDEKNLPCVAYAIIYAPEKSNIDKETRASFLEQANSMKESCRSITELKSMAQQAYQYGAVEQEGEMVIKKEKKIKNVEDWAYSKDRKIGDIDVIYEPEWGYYIVGYMGTLGEQVETAPNIRYALFPVNKESEQALKDKAKSDANAMKDACKSTDDITSLAEAAYGKGLVLDYGDFMITKEMRETMAAQKFKEWGIDENRKKGDIEVIYDEEYGGYFLVGYLGEEEYRSDALYNYVLQNLNQAISKEVEGKKHGFHTDDEFAAAPAAPTATPTPEITEEPVQTLNPDATAPSDITPAVQNTGSSMSTTDVLIVVFFTLAGVAILAVIVILINYAVKNGRKSGKAADAYSSDSEDDDEDSEEIKEADKSEESEESEDPDDEEPEKKDEKAESKEDEAEKPGDDEE